MADPSTTGSEVELQAWNGTNYRAIKMDTKTRGLTVIDHATHAVHEGNHYYIEGHVELDDTHTHYVKMTVPNTSARIHMRWRISCNAPMETQLYMDATGAMGNGSAVTPINNDHNSNNTSALVISSGCDAPSGTGTTVSNVAVGGSTGRRTVVGGTNDIADEILLKQGATYCRKFLSKDDNNIIQFRAMWGEDTPESA